MNCNSIWILCQSGWTDNRYVLVLTDISVIGRYIGFANKKKCLSVSADPVWRSLDPTLDIWSKDQGS